MSDRRPLLDRERDAAEDALSTAARVLSTPAGEGKRRPNPGVEPADLINLASDLEHTSLLLDPDAS